MSEAYKLIQGYNTIINRYHFVSRNYQNKENLFCLPIQIRIGLFSIVKET